jgi:hypothetical protein
MTEFIRKMETPFSLEDLRENSKHEIRISKQIPMTETRNEKLFPFQKLPI